MLTCNLSVESFVYRENSLSCHIHFAQIVAKVFVTNHREGESVGFISLDLILGTLLSPVEGEIFLVCFQHLQLGRIT